MKTNVNHLQVNPAAENFIDKLARFILWSGVLIGIAMFIGGISITIGNGEKIGLTLLLLGLFFIITSIIYWSLLRVIINISRNLFNIHSILKEKTIHNI